MEEILPGRDKSRYLEAFFLKVSTIFAFFTIAIGVIVLAGWILNVSIFKTINTDLISMKANTAIVFILAGAALYLSGRASGWKIRGFLSCVVLIMGALNLCEYILNADFGIDQILFKDTAGFGGTVNPGRMAPNTAVNFILMGIALLTLDARNNMVFMAGHLSAFIAGIISLMAIVGYFFGVSEFIGMQSFSKMALYTALAFNLLFIGIIFVRPQKGFMKPVTADNPGGLLLRYSIPAIIFTMGSLGWLKLYGEHAGYYNSDFGTSLFTVVRILAFIALAVIVARFVNRLHEKRIEKEMELKESGRKYGLIRETERLKSQFIAIVSHELRTPLTVIKGLVSFFKKGAVGALSEKQADYVGIIESNADRMARIVNEMTDISRIESGIFTVEKTPQALKAVVDTCVNSINQIASKNSIVIESAMAPENLVLSIDRPRIEQAIINLLNNAVKFTQPGGKIKITVEYPFKAPYPGGAGSTEAQPVFALITVSDNGTGMDKSELEKVFEKFYQIEEHTTRRHQGMGLGLFIARNIVLAHGGTIWCESEGKGKGSEFKMILPDQSEEQKVLVDKK